MKAKAFIFRPASAMGMASTQEQMDIFKAWGAQTAVVPNGVHGSSMLVETRTGFDMSETLALIAAWLEMLK